MPVTLSEDANWLVTLVVTGAQRANAYYEKLIAHYDIQRGVVDPPAGLDPIARRVMAELIQYATASYAAACSGRAIEEAHVPPPRGAADGGDAAGNAQRCPASSLRNVSPIGGERRQIERSYDELIAVGKVDHTLGDHERVVRDLYAEELWPSAGRRP